MAEMKSKKKAGFLGIGAKLDFSYKIKNILEKYGDKKIRAIRIGRRPINSKVEKAFDIISLGTWSKLRDKYYYDVLFHLFLIITLEDEVIISLEKNSIVTMTLDDNRCSAPDIECVELEYPADSITLDDLVKKTLERIGGERFFVYHPFDQNCQIFIRDILQTFNLLSAKANEFIYQDIGQIVKRLPFYVKWTAKAVTDVDATVSKVTGAGHDCDCPDDGLSLVERRKKKIDDRKREDQAAIADFVINEIIN